MSDITSASTLKELRDALNLAIEQGDTTNARVLAETLAVKTKQRSELVGAATQIKVSARHIHSIQEEACNTLLADIRNNLAHLRSSNRYDTWESLGAKLNNDLLNAVVRIDGISNEGLPPGVREDKKLLTKTALALQDELNRMSSLVSSLRSLDELSQRGLSEHVPTVSAQTMDLASGGSS